MSASEPVLCVREEEDDEFYQMFYIKRHPEARSAAQKAVGLPRTGDSKYYQDIRINIQQKFDQESGEQMGTFLCSFVQFQEALDYYGFNVLSLVFQDRYTLSLTLDVAGLGVSEVLSRFIYGDTDL